MDSIKLKANAKLNLFLDITGKRDDGYHELESVMISVGVFDTLTFEKTSGSGITIVCNKPGFPLDESNIIHKAAGALLKKHGLEGSAGLKVTVEKNIANGDFFYDPAVNNKPGRAINGPNWEIHKKIFTETLENQLLAADLKKAMRDSGVTAETSPLAQEVQGLINGCMLQYEQDDQNRFYKKNVFQFSSIMRAVEIQKIEALAKQNPDDPFAKAIAGIAEEHRKNPVNEVTKEKLQAMSEAENTAMENEISNMKLEAEDARLKTVQDSIKAVGSPLTCPEDKNLGDYFEEQKAAMADKLAELVAVKTIATTVKSYKAGNEDLGEKMSDKEVKELTDELLTEDSISQYKQDTAQREDFKRMIDSIKTWDDLAKFKEDATIHGGNKIMDKMAQQRKTILQEEKQAEAVQKQVQKQEELEDPAVQAGKPPVS